jgi:hypothetical protein
MSTPASSWSWRFEGADGTPVRVEGRDGDSFASQADAESWVGESWRALLAAGVEQAHLLRDGDVVYGPLSLRPLH